MGLEPTIPGLGGQCRIHLATRASNPRVTNVLFKADTLKVIKKEQLINKSTNKQTMKEKPRKYKIKQI